jgi:predicted MFS family arabinose efflux permease
VATSLGPGFGGIFAEFGLWREAFWGVTPLCLLFVVMALRIIPDARDGTRKPSFPFGRLLLIGTAVIALSATSQTDSLILRIGFVALSIALATTAFILDGRAVGPMFPRKALRIFTETGALYWIMALNQATVCIYATFQTLQLQVLHNVTPIVAAYLFMLSSLSWSVTAVLVATWRGKMETLGIILGSVCLVIGTAGLAYYVVPGPVYMIAIFIAICGSGIGFMNNMLIQRAIRSVPPEEKAIAGSSTQAIRTMGVAFGAALAGFVAVAGGLSSTTPTVETVAPAMQWVYGIDVIVAAAGLVIAFGMIVATKR